MIDMVSGNGGQIQVRLYLFLFKKLAFHMAIPSSLNLEMKLDSFDSSWLLFYFYCRWTILVATFLGELCFSWYKSAIQN